MGEIKTLIIERDIGKEDTWVLRDGNREIETYSVSETISFKGLVDKLLKDEFAHSYSCDDSKISEPNSFEERLVTMLKEIIDEYNKSYSEYQAFVAERACEKEKTDH